MVQELQTRDMLVEMQQLVHMLEQVVVAVQDKQEESLLQETKVEKVEMV